MGMKDVFTPAIPWVLYPTMPPSSPRQARKYEDEALTAAMEANTGGYQAHLSGYDEDAAEEQTDMRGMDEAEDAVVSDAEEGAEVWVEGPPVDEDQEDRPALVTHTVSRSFGSYSTLVDIDNKMVESAEEEGEPFTVYDQALRAWHEALASAKHAVERALRNAVNDIERPAMSVWRLNEIAFIIPAAMESKQLLSVWLRHVGPRNDRTSYGGCQLGHCCLNQDFTHANSSYDESCRHWLLYNRMEAYADCILSPEDYRLAQACATTVLAYNQVRETRREDRKTSLVQFEVRRVCGARAYFRDYVQSNRRPYAQAIPKSMTIVTPGETTKRNKPEFTDLRPGSFGVLTLRCGERSKTVRAVLMQYDRCPFWMVQHAEASIKEVQAAEYVTWEREGSLLNYARRCAAAEECGNFSFTTVLSERDTSYQGRPLVEVQRVRRLGQYIKCRKGLDEGQGRALDRAVLSEGLTLVRGPFGCGKTRVIASICIVLRSAYPQVCIFITSETNAAIDEDLRRLAADKSINGNDILRIGKPTEPMRQYREFFLSEKCQDFRQAQLDNGIRGAELVEQVGRFQDRVLRDSKIVLATVSTLGREDLRNLDAQFVINDEGAQTVEAGLLQAFRPGTTTVIAIGDPNQMLGYTGLVEKTREQFSSTGRRHKLGWSVMHTSTHQKPFEGVTLSTQYRCHPKIGKWLEGFYEYQLQHAAAKGGDYLAPFDLLADGSNLGAARACWLSIEPEEPEPEESQRANISEAWMSVGIAVRAARMSKKKRRPTQGALEVHILTPYHEQIKLIEGLLEKTKGYHPSCLKIEVSTIDSSQWRESDVVIASMVRRGSLGFLENSKECALVVLSRARDYLFVLAHAGTFMRSDWWAGLSKEGERIGVHRASTCMQSSGVREMAQDSTAIRVLCSL